MKFCLLGLTLFFSLSSYAKGPINSQALSGEYRLTKASSEFAEQYHCPEEIQISVDSNSVILESLRGIYAHDSFWAKDEGCENRAGDIGPLRTSCTRFNKKSVSDSVTEPLTIVGYIREFKRIKLLGNDQSRLKYSNNVTQIPFGILGIGNDDEFSCEYKRL
jgi:hypothetical protein